MAHYIASVLFLPLTGRNSGLLFFKPGRDWHLKEMNLSAPLLVSVSLLIVCISTSVPASRCRTLCVAEVPESKLLLGGDETREHPAGMQGGNLQLWRSQGGIWEWWENCEFGVDLCSFFLLLHELQHYFLSVIPVYGIFSKQEVSIIDRKASLGSHFLGMANYVLFRLRMFGLCVLAGVYTVWHLNESNWRFSHFRVSHKRKSS